MEVYERHIASAKGQKGAEADVSGLYGAVRQESGLPYENGQ